MADICLLPVVFQRVQLDVLWSMLCWMMRVSTWEIDSSKAIKCNTQGLCLVSRNCFSCISILYCLLHLSWLCALIFRCIPFISLLHDFFFINLDVLELLLPMLKDYWVTSSECFRHVLLSSRSPSGDPKVFRRWSIVSIGWSSFPGIRPFFFKVWVFKVFNS